ncbi:MAG: hypothetical protein ACXU9W_12950 [Thermodesulfobacteriota bacterium]
MDLLGRPGCRSRNALSMAIPVLSLISNLCKPRPRYRPGQIHLKLAGMNQDIFVRQWGAPEIDITLETLKRFFSLDFLSSSSGTFENDPTQAWIYEKMDMFVLFRKGNLIAHFKWSEFKERSKKAFAEIDSGGTKPPSFIATTLSMFT